MHERFKWQNPKEWLEYKLTNDWNYKTASNKIDKIIESLDFDTIEELFEKDMEEDQYFDPIKDPKLTSDKNLYTVLILYPQDDGGYETHGGTFTAHIEAYDVEDAVLIAKKEAAEDRGSNESTEFLEVLIVLDGHHYGLSL